MSAAWDAYCAALSRGDLPARREILTEQGMLDREDEMEAQAWDAILALPEPPRTTAERMIWLRIAQLEMTPVGRRNQTLFSTVMDLAPLGFAFPGGRDALINMIGGIALDILHLPKDEVVATIQSALARSN